MKTSTTLPPLFYILLGCLAIAAGLQEIYVRVCSDDTCNMANGLLLIPAFLVAATATLVAGVLLVRSIIFDSPEDPTRRALTPEFLAATWLVHNPFTQGNFRVEVSVVRSDGHTVIRGFRALNPGINDADQSEAEAWPMARRAIEGALLDSWFGCDLEDFIKADPAQRLTRENPEFNSPLLQGAV